MVSRNTLKNSNNQTGIPRHNHQGINEEEYPPVQHHLHT